MGHLANCRVSCGQASIDVVEIRSWNGSNGEAVGLKSRKKFGRDGVSGTIPYALVCESRCRWRRTTFLDCEILRMKKPG